MLYNNATHYSVTMQPAYWGTDAILHAVSGFKKERITTMYSGLKHKAS